jgi:putative IMPACT (imprinted ancient) family translation regulator
VAKKSEFAAKTSITKYKNSIEDFLKKKRIEDPITREEVMCILLVVDMPLRLKP